MLLTLASRERADERQTPGPATAEGPISGEKPMRWIIAPILVMAAVMVGPDGARSDVVDWIVAVVNDDIVLHSDLQRRLEEVKAASPRLEAEMGEDALRRTVLQQMIRERLTEQEVKRYGISVSEAEVDEAVERLKQANGYTDDQLEYVLGQEGGSLETLREKVRKELERSRLLQRVLKSKTVITREQIDAAMQSVERSSEGERRRLAVILLPAARGDGEKLAREISDRLKRGEDFADLARRHSQGPARQEGGDIGYIATEELAPDIREATRGLGRGEISEIVRSKGSYYIFKVLDVESRPSAVADETLRDKVHDRLFQQEINRKYEEWIQGLERRSFIKIHLDP